MPVPSVGKTKHNGTVPDLLSAGPLKPYDKLISTNTKWPGEALILPDGRIEHAGHVFDSASGAGKALVGSSVNSWIAWAVETDAGLVSLAALRAQLEIKPTVEPQAPRGARRAWAFNAVTNSPRFLCAYAGPPGRPVAPAPESTHCRPSPNRVSPGYVDPTPPSRRSLLQDPALSHRGGVKSRTPINQRRSSVRASDCTDGDERGAAE